MNFPKWVDSPPEQTDVERATKRLQFILRTVALQMTSGTLLDFANMCGIDRTSLHANIRKGAISAAMATQIERACGRDLIRHEDLMRPLEIASE